MSDNLLLISIERIVGGLPWLILVNSEIRIKTVETVRSIVLE
jgi:hypothetical protein